jgi:hypothetical protein
VVNKANKINKIKYNIIELVSLSFMNSERCIEKTDFGYDGRRKDIGADS